MSKTELTGRERVNRMFDRQDHDRVPRHDSFWDETIIRWQGEGLAGDAQAVLDLLGSDYQRLCWSWPAPFPDRREVVSEDDQTEVVVDAWGATARFWKERSGTPEHIGFECDAREGWEKRFKPAMLATDVQIALEQARKDYAAGRKAGRWCFLAGVESFECRRKLIGAEMWLVAMATDPDWIRDISRTHTDLVIRDFEAALALGIQPDGVWIYGDMAYNRGTFCSPSMYRELIWPDHKRLVAWTHTHGMKFIFHTDGDVNGVVDLYIDAGFDCLQPLEAKAGMDIRELCPRYGDGLAFFGNIDIMVMISNDREKIEQEIAAKLAAGKATRGYAYHSDHSVPPQVTWETYQFIVEMLDRYGRYI